MRGSAAIRIETSISTSRYPARMIASTTLCCWRRASSSPVVDRCPIIALGPRSGGLSVVAAHRVADREGGCVGAQPQHGGGDLLRTAHAPDGLLSDDCGAAFVGVAREALHHR